MSFRLPATYCLRGQDESGHLKIGSEEMTANELGWRNETISSNISYVIQCNASNARRDYLSEADMHNPVLLLSLPGSGNTWVRLLLEYSVGIYTGSIYTDLNLLKALPGERFCGQRMSGSHNLCEYNGC